MRAGAVAAVSDLTVRGVRSSILGSDENCGGGIRNLGHLTVGRLAVLDNLFRGNGGGICNDGGVLTVSDSTIGGNHAALFGAGGGILNWPEGYTLLKRVTVVDNHAETAGGAGVANFGTMVVVDSTITGNVASNDPPRGAGGISNGPVLTVDSPVSLTVVNSTISGNWTDGTYGGGGLATGAGASATIIGSTITGNHTVPWPFGSQDEAPTGGGVSNHSESTLALLNTIVAGNENGDCRTEPDSALPVSLGHNLDGDGSCALDSPGDISGSNPYLGQLADNGGPTLTHAILTVGSPAVDGGDDAQCPAADQRGAPRPVDGNGSGGAQCDIGAFEYRGVVPPPGPEARGDADCDSAVTVLNGLYVLRHLALGEGLPECAGTADVDCSGDVNELDALLVLYTVAALAVPPC